MSDAIEVPKKEDEITWIHMVLAFPTLILFVWGMLVGIIIGPLVYGCWAGLQESRIFWGFKTSKDGQ